MTAQSNKRPTAIRMVLPFVFRHWLHQPRVAATTAGGFLGATVADLFMPLFSGHLVDALTSGAADPAARRAAWTAFGAIVAPGALSMPARATARPHIELPRSASCRRRPRSPSRIPRRS